MAAGIPAATIVVARNRCGSGASGGARFGMRTTGGTMSMRSLQPGEAWWLEAPGRLALELFPAGAAARLVSAG